MRAASNDSFAVPPSVPATASAYIDSNPPLTFAPPRIPNWLVFVIATAPDPPDRIAGIAGDSGTPRNGGTDFSFLTPTARARNPSSVDFTPGVPDSMKSCASKCERVVSGEPTAWTTARLRSLTYGDNDASDGCNPKKPSRSIAPPSAPGRG